MSQLSWKKFVVLFALFAALAGATSRSWAVNGTWIDTTSPAAVNWSNGPSWQGGNVADGAGGIANFNTIDVPATDITVTLDSSRSIGQLIFGDTDTSSAGNWIIAGANTLTLDNTGGTGGPVITVNALGTGKSATISDTIAGTAGFTKNGVGTLGVNSAYGGTFSGATILDGGTLTYAATNANVKALQFGVVTSGAGSTNLSTVNINENVTATSLLNQTASTSGNTLSIASGKILTVNGPITVGYDLGASGAAATTRLNVTGGGSLVAGAAGQILTVGTQSNSGNANSITSILDLSALNSFQYTGSEVRVVGNGTTSGTGDRSNGRLILSNTANTLTVGTVSVATGSG